MVAAAPFRDRTGTKMWRAAETAAESAKGNADEALAMLRMRALPISRWPMRRGIS